MPGKGERAKGDNSQATSFGGTEHSAFRKQVTNGMKGTTSSSSFIGGASAHTGYSTLGNDGGQQKGKLGSVRPDHRVSEMMPGSDINPRVIPKKKGRERAQM